MNFSSRRIVVVAATTLAVVGGGAAAVAATGGGSRTSDFLDSVAKHLGVSPQKLEDATKAAAIDQVNADLAAGRITKDQADELKKRIEAGDGVLAGPRLGYGGPRGPGGPDGPGGFGFGPGVAREAITHELAAAAKYLGLSEIDLRTKLRDGQSLADVAKAQSKDLAGLKTAILATAKADLDKAVADKKLTQSQADDIYSGLKVHIDDIVNADAKLRHFDGPGPKFGFGADTAAAAKYLGLSDSALRAKLRDGQSLGDVAKAQSKDVQGLEDAIVASQKARLDQAVSDKKLTQSQADDIADKLKSHVADLVNAKLPDRPPFGTRRDAGPRFFFGP